jgi:hypothetical protein
MAGGQLATGHERQPKRAFRPDLDVSASLTSMSSPDNGAMTWETILTGCTSA